MHFGVGNVASLRSCVDESNELLLCDLSAGPATAPLHVTLPLMFVVVAADEFNMMYLLLRVSWTEFVKFGTSS